MALSNEDLLKELSAKPIMEVVELVTLSGDVIDHQVQDHVVARRQGADVGPQYRSVIFYHDEMQKETAENLIAELDAAEIWPNPIVTEIEPLGEFYPAEDYHTLYFGEILACYQTD